MKPCRKSVLSFRSVVRGGIAQQDGLRYRHPERRSAATESKGASRELSSEAKRKRISVNSLSGIFLLLPFVIFCVSCSSPKEEVKPVTPEVQQKLDLPKIDARVFKFEDRYYVKNAAIDKATNIDDPVQALRVIQLKPGANETLVISAFDKVDGEAQETWLGLEFPSLAPGTYDLAKAVEIKFYRFYLGESHKRFDGNSIEGKLTIEERKDGNIIGYVDATIKGVTKAFDTPSQELSMKFFGSFKIQEVDLDATRIPAPKK